jgi:hypothetical protein
MSTVGLIMMVLAVVIGNDLQTEITMHGVDNYLSRNGAHGWVRFMLFAFGFPGGLAISLMGTLVTSGDKTSRLIFISIVLLLACLMPVISLKLFDTERSANFFGTAGYILMLLIVLSMWHWSVHRSLLSKGLRLGADLQGAGNACFAMAAWNLCGVGGMPSYALNPEHMLGAGTHDFATGQMKAIMLLLIIGWLLTLAGYRTYLLRLRASATHTLPASSSHTES